MSAQRGEASAIRVLAISSGGGHWVQLGRVLPAFEGAEIVLATVSAVYRDDYPCRRFHVVPDATRWDRLKLIACALRVAWLLLRERPHVVFTTGAAPGGLAILLGRLSGARTIWLDSIANVESLSMTGLRARRWADLWLTQWPHLAGPDGPRYLGAVL